MNFTFITKHQVCTNSMTLIFIKIENNTAGQKHRPDSNRVKIRAMPKTGSTSFKSGQSVLNRVNPRRFESGPPDLNRVTDSNRAVTYTCVYNKPLSETLDPSLVLIWQLSLAFLFTRTTNKAQIKSLRHNSTMHTENRQT